MCVPNVRRARSGSARRRNPCNPGGGEWQKALPRRGRLPGGSDRSAAGSGALSLPEAGARRGEPGGEAERAPGPLARTPSALETGSDLGALAPGLGGFLVQGGSLRGREGKSDWRRLR